MIFHVKDTCPKCHGDIRQTSIEVHPMNLRLAVRMLHCPKCGLIPTKPLSLTPAALPMLAPQTAR